jgi:predicted Mrr-cat superfamily restriction endonuclease
MADDDRQAWVIRMSTGGGDVVDDGLRDGFVYLGWSDAEGLISCDDYWRFREIIHETYYSGDGSYVRSGRAASQLWNFIHDAKLNDLVVVPHGPEFYVAQVDGPAEYDNETGPEDTAYRRSVRWLNDAQPIPRTTARSALISRMRSRQTLTSASDIQAEILEAVGAAQAGETPTMAASLRESLIQTTKRELLTGHMDERRFEEMVRDLVLALGAVDAHIVSRRHDIGADIEAEFSVGHFANIPVRIQVKYWRDEASSYPVDQLLNAMPDVDLGVVVTTASFSDEVRDYAAARAEDAGKQLVLVDGDELCRLIVDYGLGALLGARTA